MRIALSVGHHPTAPGAATVDGESEFQFNDKLISKIMAGYNGPHQLIKVYRKTHAMPVDEINELNPDFFVEFHFNSFHEPKATGIEVLHYPSKKSTAIAKIFVEHLHRALGLTLRQGGTGLKPMRSGRGAYLLTDTKMPGCLLESFFGSNPTDVRVMRERYDILVNELCAAIDAAAFEISEGK